VSQSVVDSGRATIQVLPEIIEVVGGRMPVLVDSGFRRGTDIIKALAMGAQAVCIGRPYLWGLGASVSRVSSASWRSCVGKRVPPCRRSERINQAPNLGSGAAGLSLSRHGTKDLAAGHARDAVRNLVQMFAFHPFEPIPAGDRERQVWGINRRRGQRNERPQWVDCGPSCIVRKSAAVGGKRA